jgi:hypothetical protein
MSPACGGRGGRALGRCRARLGCGRAPATTVGRGYRWWACANGEPAPGGWALGEGSGASCRWLVVSCRWSEGARRRAYAAGGWPLAHGRGTDSARGTDTPPARIAHRAARIAWSASGLQRPRWVAATDGGMCATGEPVPGGWARPGRARPGRARRQQGWGVGASDRWSVAGGRMGRGGGCSRWARPLPYGRGSDSGAVRIRCPGTHRPSRGTQRRTASGRPRPRRAAAPGRSLLVGAWRAILVVRPGEGLRFEDWGLSADSVLGARYSELEAGPTRGGGGFVPSPLARMR